MSHKYNKSGFPAAIVDILSSPNTTRRWKARCQNIEQLCQWQTSDSYFWTVSPKPFTARLCSSNRSNCGWIWGMDAQSCQHTDNNYPSMIHIQWRFEKIASQVRGLINTYLSWKLSCNISLCHNTKKTSISYHYRLKHKFGRVLCWAENIYGPLPNIL